MSYTVAMPCRTDEPAVAVTLDCLAAAWGVTDTDQPRLVVCVNGDGPADAPVVTTLRQWAVQRGLQLDVLDLDQPHGAAPTFPSDVRILRTQRAGKANAWNHLRRACDTPLVLFLDADVTFAPPVPGQLLAALIAAPPATLASARTQAHVRPTPFERIQAVPYQFPFGTLSPQLYAARTARLPPAMPDDLLEPERWLELVVGAGAIVQAPGAIVTVRLPATLADFFRQRVRIEQAKLQLCSEYPGLAARGRHPPAPTTIGQHYQPSDLARLAVYAMLRATARLIAHGRQARGQTNVAWHQARSTKQPY